jgi:6-pyruvoyltetrahydropterin/6-carboxytetrahydropterin synthase
METPHWHEWRVEAALKAPQLDRNGMVIDFMAVQAAMRAALQGLEGQDLNAVTAFEGVDPTTEHVARYVHDELAPRLSSSSARLVRIVIHEAPGCSVTYLPD